MRLPTAVDLYAGAGGASQGLKDAGYSVVGAIEFDAVAAETYRLNHGEVHLRVADIRKVDAARFREELGIPRGNLGLLQACPPCQTWSSLGKQLPEDPRNDLVFDVLRFIDAFLPRALVLENVPGLANDPRLAKVGRLLRRHGYGLRKYVVDAVEFGVPQRRRRLILLAVRGGDGRALPRRLSDAMPAEFERSLRTVGDAIGRLRAPGDDGDSLHRSRTPTSAVLERIKAIKEGGNRFDLPPHLRLACHERLSNRNATASYGRMRSDAPAPTLTTRCTTPACGSFIHPTEDRGLTLREAALLQTFPPTYAFSGTYGQVERQIGNAIPVRMAEGIARGVTALAGGIEVAKVTLR